jgi:hypothetical protein
VAGGTTLLELMKLNVLTPAQVVDSNALPLRGIGTSYGLTGWRGGGSQFQRRGGDLVAVVFGQSLIAGIDQDLHLWVDLQQDVDAFGPGGGEVVHPPRSGSAAPQRYAVGVGYHGGLDGVLLKLAGHERLTARSAGTRPTNPDLGGVQPQCDTLGRSVSEHVGQGP